MSTQNEEIKAVIRTSVRSLYDLQKLRIQTGNRITAAFRVKLGLDSSQPEEENKEAHALLQDLRSEFKRITDGVKRLTKTIKIDSPLITHYGELMLLEGYERQLEAEAVHEKAIKAELEKLPIYMEFLEDVRGVGPLMAGVIVSELDIHKCNSISALWKYCGLDVVVYEEKVQVNKPEYCLTLRGKVVPGQFETLKDAENYLADLAVSIDIGEYEIIEDPDFKPEFEMVIREEGRCRKKHHLVPKTYTNREGKITETVGISFNDFVKTKLVGVLGSSFIKLGGDYRDVYDNYKHRISNMPRHANKTKGHIHNMAVRYMIKEFLADLWTVWRALEGLPVRPRYSEEKLGIVHSKPSHVQEILDRIATVYGNAA